MTRLKKPSIRWMHISDDKIQIGMKIPQGNWDKISKIDRAALKREFGNIPLSQVDVRDSGEVWIWNKKQRGMKP